MDLKMKKSKVEGRILEVVSPEDYAEHPELYENTCTGVQLKYNDKDYVLPHRATQYSEDRPGIYRSGAIDQYVFPDEEHEEEYTNDVIDFSDTESIGELSQKLESVRDIERDILTSPDSIFTPILSERDSPEMRGLKEAVIAKHIDLDKYADRFGDNYPNDKRQFKKDNITLFMMKRMCDCLDMKAKLVIEDTDPNVPNPIGKQIVVDLTGGSDEDE